jgi:hypothetical protein
MQNTAGFSQCRAVQLATAVGDRQAKAILLTEFDEKIPTAMFEAKDETH